MKSFILAALMVISFSSQAQEMDAVDSLLSVLPLGSFSGLDDNGATCTVLVSETNFPSKAVSVTASNNKSKIFKVIHQSDEFIFNEYKKEFIQSERYYVDASRNSYVDRILRTVDSGIQNHLYVIVANEIIVNRDRKVEAVECVIKL